jgi:hypothetical protein
MRTADFTGAIADTIGAAARVGRDRPRLHDHDSQPSAFSAKSARKQFSL